MNVEQILKNQYHLIREIGSGAFGKVYMAEDVQDKQKKYAIKRIPKQKICENEYLKLALYKELEIMKSCSCENSILFIEDFETTSNHNIVMELCDNDLEFILSRRLRGFSEEDLKIILLQLKNVFDIMDTKNIIHRDLKLKNIMICLCNNNSNNNPNNNSISPHLKSEKSNKDNISIANHPTSTNNESDLDIKYSAKNFIVKLADFGFSKVLDEDITSTKLGTPATMAPEIMMNKQYCKKADIWSLGIIMFQLLYKKLPFNAKNENELLKLILNSNGYNIPEGYTISKTLDDLLKNVLQKDKNLRFSWKDFFDHEFFRDAIRLENYRKGRLQLTNYDLCSKPIPENFNVVSILFYI